MKVNDKLISLLREIEAAKIHYTLARHHNDSVMVQAAVPGERWEIQVFEDGRIEVERFASNGTIVGEDAVRQWINKFTD